MTTLNEAVALSKSAGSLTKNNESTKEVLEAYQAAYSKFEEAKDSDADKTETQLQWGIALTNNYKYVID